MKTNMLVDTSTLEVIKKMDKEMGYDFIVGLLEYGLYGKEPQFNELALQLAFIPIKIKTDFNIERYENCVRNGEKGKEYGVQGAEYGKLGGRPRKGETKEEYAERKKQETNTLPNCEIPQKDSEREKWGENVIKNFKKKSEKSPTPKEITQNNPISEPNEGASLEAEFRGKLGEGDNRKWITDYYDFSNATFNPDFKEWLEGREFEHSDIERLWNKYRKTYLERLSNEIDVSQGTDKEIYDYIKEKRYNGFLQGSFKMACWNSKEFTEWMKGYDRTRVEIIFNFVNKEIDAMKKQALGE